MTSGGLGFAVVDVETTGLFPSRDRVIEIGIVLLDEDAKSQGEYCTLVNPLRDVGPTRVHGITAEDVINAPTFGQVAWDIWQRLVGRVFVAHNVQFDFRFLSAEFARSGFAMPTVPSICTMRLATAYLSGAPSRSLVACCEAAHIPLSHHHNALDDARAAAALLGCFRATHSALPASWLNALQRASAVSWEPSPPPVNCERVDRATQIARRAGQGSPLSSLVHQLPRGEGSQLDSYLGLLDRVLEDRIIEEGEVDQLAQLAHSVGLTREAADSVHLQYLAHVAKAARADGVVTDRERADLLHVARLLDVAESTALRLLTEDTLLEQVPIRGLLRPGDRVAITGDTEVLRSELVRQAEAVGLRVTNSVSKKTALLVAADPHSESGKARVAHSLGVRIIVEPVFLDMLRKMANSVA